MRKECTVCGKSLWALSKKIQVTDGYLCAGCWNMAGLDPFTNGSKSGSQYSTAIIKEMIADQIRKLALMHRCGK